MDTINGYHVIATFPTKVRGCDPPGRIIIIDRSTEYEERYVVAWQGMSGCERANHWEQSVYCRTLDVARDLFVVRVQKEVL